MIPLNIRRFMCKSTRKFHDDAKLRESVEFWKKTANLIDWYQAPFETLSSENPPFYRWYKGGKMNTSYNCLDRHLEKFGDRNALIFDSPVTNTIKNYTYNGLYVEVNKFASLLKSCDVKKGDRVVIYMPNLPEALIAMLACARIGATHSVVFGGFASAELATRIRDCKPKVIVSSSCGIDGSKVIPYKPLLDKALELVAPDHKVKNCIVLQRKEVTAELIPGRDINWADAMSALGSNTEVAPESLDSDHPLYILYTSGTTGKPKGILRDNGGHAVALTWSMRNVFGVNPGDVFWAASDIGWVVGHSFSLYGPLLNGSTSVIYEGKPVGTPDASNFWRTMERHKVNVFFTAPTALRAIKRMDPDGLLTSSFDLSNLRRIFLAGERADSSSIHWAENCLKVPVFDNWWQTETGWPICGNQINKTAEGYLPVKYGSCFVPCPGYDLQVLDASNNPVNPGEMGSLAAKLPLPPGTMLTLYGNDDRFVEAYMTKIPGYYDTGDAGIIDEDGYVHVMSRTDDVINVAGHRLSTSQMEEILSSHHDIAEVAVVGVRCGLKGQNPLGLVVLNNGCTRTEEELVPELVKLVRDELGAVANFKKAVVVTKLPKTRSGKILRMALRAIANHDVVQIPPTIEDPSTLEEAERIIRAHEND